MIDILNLDKPALLALDPNAVDERLRPEEVIHMATELGAFWSYHYDRIAAKPGLHALLKSGLHSDGFFVSRILLASENIRRVMAEQMVKRLVVADIERPTHVAGIPDGATLLGEAVAQIFDRPHLKLEKVEGKIVLAEPVPPRAQVLLVEDFCTRGTGFAEAVLAILSSPLRDPTANIVRINPVIINRGGLEVVSVEGHGDFPVLSVVNRRIQDWAAAECPLCQAGSEPIKPKMTDENWSAIIHSQD